MLCGHKNLISGDARCSDALAYCGFVAVSKSGVDVAVTRIYCFNYRIFCDLAVGCEVCSVSDARHFDSVGENECICKFVHFNISFKQFVLSDFHFFNAFNVTTVAPITPRPNASRTNGIIAKVVADAIYPKAN